MTWDAWIIFSAVFFAATIAPGPGMLLAMSHAIVHGRRRFLVTAAGQISASFIQTAVSLAGLGAIMMSSVAAFEIIRWAGALYLIYLGIKMWRAPLTSSFGTGNLPSRDINVRTSSGRIFRDSFLVCLSNPKAIVFFGSLFPQFFSPGNLNAINILMLCACMSGVIILCVFIWSSGGRYLSIWLRNSNAQKYLNRSMGGCFIGAGVGIAASR